jgi:hypothetical protein
MGKVVPAEAIMRLYAKTCLTIAILTASLAMYGQAHYHFADTNLLARLAFDSGGLQSPGSQHTCLAVDRDGSYRMMRTNEGLRMIRTLNLDPAEPLSNEDIRTLLDSTQRLEGTLSPEQLLQLKTLLESSDLRFLSGNHFALIRQSAEIFTAEIPVLDKQVSDSSLHVHLLNADGRTPFPAPVRKIVDWLSRFEPTNAKRSANLDFQDVCPSGGLQLVQPVASDMP